MPWKNKNPAKREALSSALLGDEREIIPKQKGHKGSNSGSAQACTGKSSRLIPDLADVSKYSHQGNLHIRFSLPTTLWKEPHSFLAGRKVGGQEKGSKYQRKVK